MSAQRLVRYAVVLLLVSLAAGQDSPLDLKGALAEAQSRNLELRAARQQRAQALAGITVAGQIPNPTVSFSATRDTPHESIVWDQPLEIGGQRAARLAVSREEQHATEIEIAVLERQVRHRTRDAFYRALWARATRDQAQQAEDLATRTRDVAKQRFDAGDVAELDVLQADVESTRATVDRETAQQSQRSADAQLAGLLNHPVMQALSLQGSLGDIPAGRSLEEVTQFALASSADIQRRTQDVRTEERRLTLAQRQRIPNLDLQAGVDLNSPPEFDVGGRGQVGVTLPLFYHGQGEVRLQSAKLEFARLSLQAEQTMISAEVAAAYFDYSAKAYQARQYKERILPEAERLEQMSEDSYRFGKSNLLTLIDAQRKLNEVRRAYLDSLLAAQSSFANLEEVAGADLD
jgi:cobalt-zinc-cadmium efflux system outer membrane protein